MRIHSLLTPHYTVMLAIIITHYTFYQNRPCTWYSVGALIALFSECDLGSSDPASFDCDGKNFFSGAGGPSIIIQYLMSYNDLYT